MKFSQSDCKACPARASCTGTTRRSMTLPPKEQMQALFAARKREDTDEFKDTYLDTYHMNIEEADFTTPVLACGDRLGYVHVGESHRGYLGTGTVDFPAFFSALAAVNYQGIVTFESFSSAVVAPGLSTTLTIWRNTWTDSADLARHAREFIDAGLHGAQVALTGA